MGLSELKNLLAVLCFGYQLLSAPETIGTRTVVSVLQILVFGVAGFVLYRMGRTNAGRLLGAVFTFVANAYVLNLIFMPLERGTWAFDAAAVLVNFRFELLIAWFMWRFVAAFPDAPIPWKARRPFRVLEATALGTGLLLVVSGVLRTARYFYFAQFGGETFPKVFDLIADLVDLRWELVIPQTLMACIGLMFKFQTAPKAERRRVKVFFTGFLVAFGIPMSMMTFENMTPGLYARVTADDFRNSVWYFTVNLLLLTAPFATAYAVVAHKVLDVQLIARSAVQHLLARTSATILGLAPFFFLVLFLFQNRGLTLEQLFTGQRALVLVVTTAVGLIFLRFREPILDGIDRRFFRDRYNARVVLTQLAEQVRGTRNVRELSNMVGQGVDLALHLERVTLLAQDPQLGHFIDPQDNLRPLDPGSRLATLVQGQREPLEVDLDSPASPLHGLDERERHWLVDGKIELIAPTYSLDGGMIGLLALGGKKSELPFLKEDRDLLQSVCSATGLVLELMTLKEQTLPPTRVTPIPVSPSGSFPIHEIVDPVAEGARECALCQRIYPASETRCPRDDFELESTLVPYVLRGQYRFEKRLGSGGMAVVYLATDLRLGRSVAIKTLPRVSPEAAMRLHREARTAATVTHPGLASIYGIETWEGVPMLILELLPGGTLADQLMAGEPLDPLLAVDMGKSVALALQKIHRAGILHRDIKPSNIGYTEEGQAKLLDFGVARIQHDLRQETGDLASGEPVDERSRVLNTADWMIGRTATGQLVGTLSYLSPEAVRAGRPEPSVDLWALNVVLWESLTGENLFKGRLMPQVLDNIRDGKTKSIRERLPDCPEPVAEYFDRELALDKSRRAASGRELHDRLVELERQLVD
ncbi:MAG: serine/threonine-protein kinase [Acidobacteriota bacterium]